MPDWSAGYVADIGYTYGTYPELNPLRLHLPFLSAGLKPPAVAHACELGFGQGMSVNIHAAASNVTWHGTDFNPAQAAFARELAAASGAAAHLVDQSFEQFCSRDDLPEFDFIGLHGIFSWISDENRRIIVDFVSRKLKLGGVLYISYNTQPGWAAMAPVRDLMGEYANTMVPPGAGSAGRVEQSLAFVERLFATEPTFLKANPRLTARFEKLKTQNRSYVAHEYFNRYYWVKGARRLGAIERDEQLLGTRIMLLTPRADVPMKTMAGLGEVALQPKVYDPLFDYLTDRQPHTIGELLEHVKKQYALTQKQVIQAITILAGQGHVSVLHDDEAIGRAAPAAQRLNLRLCELAMSSAELQWLALPGTGGAIPADRFQQLFLLARSRGGKDPEAWAAFAHAVLTRQGQRLIVDGKKVETDAQQLTELVRRAAAFRDKQLPVLTRLGAAA